MHLVAYNFTERLPKDGFQYIERASETFSYPCLLIYRLFIKRAVPLGGTHADVITSLMVNVVWRISIPQILIGFHD